MKCDVHESDVQLHHIPGMGRRFIDFSDCFERLVLSSLAQIFLDIRFFVLFVFLASVCLFPLSLSSHPAAGPGLFFWVASLGGLHVGHFKTDTASRLRGGSLDRFCLMSYWTVATSSLSMACQLMIGRSYVLVSQTGIECQQDMLRGGGKSYTGIWHVAVILCPWALGGWVDGGARSCVETRLRPWRVCSWDVVFCLRNIHARRTWVLDLFHLLGHGRAGTVGSSPTLQDSVLGDESDAGHRSKLLYSK
jgi:hypothetical protein